MSDSPDDKTSLPLLVGAAIGQALNGVNAAEGRGNFKKPEIAADNGAHVSVPPSSKITTQVTRVGVGDGLGNSIATSKTSDITRGSAKQNAISVGSHNGADIAVGRGNTGPGKVLGLWGPELPISAPAPTSHSGSFVLPYGLSSGKLAVSNSGNSDGNKNTILVGQSNTGKQDGSQNTAVVGDGNGVSVSVPTGAPNSSGFRLNLSQVGHIEDPSGLLGGLNSATPAQDFVAPPIKVIFESLNIIIADSGNDDGNSNTVRVGDQNSGSFDGNQNLVSVGNSNGVSLTVVNSPDAVLLTQLLRLNISGSGNFDGNNNQVEIGSGNTSSHDGDNNAALIGNNNGVVISAGSGRPGAADQGTTPDHSFPELGPQVSSLGTFWFPGVAAPLDVVSEAATLNLSEESNGLSDESGSFDGNGNTILIGNQNGINLSFLLGSGDAGDMVSESVLINVLNSGNNDGNNNSVQIGSDNGGSGTDLLSSAAVGLPPVSGAASIMGLATSPGWSDLSLTDVLRDLVANAPVLPRNLIMESVGITVMNSGNNDGNYDTAMIGSGNAGGNDGNRNSVAFGDNNGVIIHV